MTASGLAEAEQKMREAGVADVAIATFAHYYEQLAEGESGLIAEDEIEPVADVPSIDDLPDADDAARSALEHTIVLRLNGGLGTSMGMTRAKSLLQAKDGLTFLDLIARQVLALRERTGARLPLVLMNSFYTREDSLEALGAYPDLAADVPPDFIQNKEPKLLVDGLPPVEWPPDPDLEWCPPGHGDLYTALQTSGLLAALREHDYRYALVANSDNLGATLDERILGFLAREEIPFLMEVADRTAADRKGGHIARRRSDGRLILRELAQTPDEDADAFADIERHRFFNTNNLWIDLEALERALAERDGVLGLPLIRNRKTVDPGDPESPEVFQIETAMGAAIAVFEGAQALRVGRERFAPVKTTDDLLVVRSDVYEVTEDARVVVSPRREGSLPLVELDSDSYKRIDDFQARFPDGPPSLVEAESLAVEGDVRFGAGVVVRGRVRVTAGADGQRLIEPGTELEG